MKNEIFKANPNLDCYFETTDSQCFFTDADAKNHAKTLEDKTIKPHHRYDYEPVLHPTEAERKTELVEAVATTEPVLHPTEAEQKTELVEAVATTEPVLHPTEAEQKTELVEAVKPKAKK
ncbi:hypothetical protein [Flavobacterium psychrophilum]|uniref:hypothetical protein n=1 Tax=Flavobacterium psychrophilum TaxID=96345 RepID=UPI001D06303A|nr:hypothetical protein [Flavobacterium psychrophilum]MCB6097909.1 hypothetical protein [Flavobacterium psychrophilum]